jgi:hypothetical protein
MESRIFVKKSRDANVASCIAPTWILIEINPRPPGFQSLYGTRITYGIDHITLHLLACLRKTRIHAVPTQPLHPPACIHRWGQILVPHRIHRKQWSQVVVRFRTHVRPLPTTTPSRKPILSWANLSPSRKTMCPPYGGRSRIFGFLPGDFQNKPRWGAKSSPGDPQMIKIDLSSEEL